MYKYNNGYQEFDINNVNELIYLIQNGQIDMDTTLLDVEDGKYKRVADIQEVKSFKQQWNKNNQFDHNMNNGPKGPSQNINSSRRSKKPHLLLGVIISIVFLAAAATGVYLSRDSMGLFKTTGTTFSKSSDEAKNKKTTRDNSDEIDKKSENDNNSKTGKVTKEVKSKKEGKLKLAVEKLFDIYKDAEGEDKLKSESFDKAKYGEYTEALKFTCDFLIELHEVTNLFQSDVENYNLDQLVSENTLKDIDKIIGARMLLQAAAGEFNDFEVKVDSIINKYSSKASMLDVPREFKAVFFAGFSKTKDEDLIRLKELFTIEADIIKKVDEILEYLEQRKGKYRLESGKVTFNSQEDSDGFNKLAHELNDLITREAEWQQQRKKNAQKSLNDFEKALEDIFE